MRSSLVSVLLASTALALVASPASAITVGGHKITGKYAVTFGTNTNIGAAPSKAGPSNDTDDEIDEEDVADELGVDVEDLEDIVDDQELDDEDLADDDAEDLDGDGELDSTDPSRPAPRADGDQRTQHSFSLGHGYTFNKQFSWKSAAVAGLNRQKDRGDLNRNNWAFNTGPVFSIPSLKLQINPSITYAELSKDHKNQNESYIYALAGAWKATKDLSFSARYTREERDNVRPRATDISVNGYKLGAAYALTKKDKIALNLGYKEDRNDNSDKDKDSYGYDISYARKLPWKLAFTAKMAYGDATIINSEDPERNDDSYTYSGVIGRGFDNGLFANLGATYKSKSVNIPNKGNHDKGASLELGWKF